MDLLTSLKHILDNKKMLDTEFIIQECDFLSKIWTNVIPADPLLSSPSSILLGSDEDHLEVCFNLSINPLEDYEVLRGEALDYWDR